ncbi:HlyD family efflux transporter periplasmic adaptor subunit [Chitinophaga horti]|uniref:HlyD family efflux transporter periplasmic adaptor subunit n=1 Tax=Chitinophaga horti TaxID=2920382 RepID=A0ABY6J7W9_9BACT|nr:HlyD family efflux transporter periplasmic adaptor subunit [Chitinophaga horti]UYQ94376.1 HlyD family efflux transporter periplasmic adaptor subunit [Chitinophaga horti]
MKSIINTIVALVLLSACGNNEREADAYGNFEATEVIVSAEGTGKLTTFNIEEGNTLAANALVGSIDSTQLHLKQQQLGANIKAVLSKQPDITPQLEVIRQQIATQEKEKRRVENLLKANAATPKQLDDINAQIAVLQKQMTSMSSSLQTQIGGLRSETRPLELQIDQLRDQLDQTRILNPVNGTVLTKYVEQGEVVTYGKPLYRIADLSEMTLRVYVGANQLSAVKIGQAVKVRTDAADGQYRYWTGNVSWIAAEAEFTPKIIQTKEERTQLVYAVKVRVKNDGALKIGMPGEILLNN